MPASPGAVQAADPPKAAADGPFREGAFATRLARAQAEQQQPAPSQDVSGPGAREDAPEDATSEPGAETAPPAAVPMLLLLLATAPQACAITAPAAALGPARSTAAASATLAVEPMHTQASNAAAEPSPLPLPLPFPLPLPLPLPTPGTERPAVDPLKAVSDAGAGALPSAAFTPSTATVVLPAPGAPAGAPAPSVHVPAAVDTPAFAPALAQRVGVLVRDGQSLATLNLNPPELGPVAVHIVVEGKQARVDFVAELACTRSAIESSLPSLAAALQEIGLTLSGGGVFDGRPRREAAEPPVQRGAGSDVPTRAQSPSHVGVAVRQAPRGLVDLIA